MTNVESNALTMGKTNFFHTVKARTIAAILSIAAAAALPQIFHVLGAVSGMGTGLGQTLLPMHLPVLMAGLLAGPMVGVAVGAISPIISFALSGMPVASMLPFMVIELAAYGLSAGLLSTVKIPTFAKVLTTQIAGRALRAIVILIAFYGLGAQAASVSSIWNSVVAGLPGLLLQWTIIPLLIFWIENREKRKDTMNE